MLGLRWLGPAGTGPVPAHVVVLVHGIGMSHRSFRRLRAVLAVRQPTVTVDLPGFGGVPGDGRAATPTALADLVVRALRSRGVVTMTVVGQSMGTQVTMEAAIRHPRVVTGIVLVAQVVDDRRRTVLAQFADLMRDGPVESTRMNLVVAGDSLRSLRQYLRVLGPMLRYPMLERIRGVRQPIVVVRGEDDPIARPGWVRRLLRANPAAVLEELPGPHHVQEWDPVGVADVVDRLVGGEGEPAGRAGAVPPVRRPRPGPLRLARWWVEDWVYAGIWQLRALGPTSPDDYRSGDGQPVVVLPGVYETWHFLRPLMEALHDDGHPVHVVTELQYNLRPVPDSARIVMDLLERESLTDVLVLAHSKGGLIGKYAMTSLDTGRRIDRMVAVSTPFTGSRWARLAPPGHLRIFRASDPVLAALARERAANARITSVYGVVDTMIPDGSELDGARNVQLPVGGHFRILGDPRTYRVVLEASRRPAPRG